MVDISNMELDAEKQPEGEENLDTQGYASVSPEITSQVKEQLENDLHELPSELRRVCDRIAPGVGGEVFARAQELSGVFRRQLEDSAERDKPASYGSDNAAIDSERESLNVGEINSMVTALKLLAEQLAEQVRGQRSESKVLDLDKLSSNEPRAAAELWYLLTGQSEFGTGREVIIGEYTLTSMQTQEAQGPGADSRKFVLRKIEAAPPQEAGREVVSATPEASPDAPFVKELPLNPKQAINEASKEKEAA